MKWAEALSDGYADSFAAFGHPLVETIREAEGNGPRDELFMALDWVSMAGYADLTL